MTPEEAKQRAAELIADNQLDLAEVVAEWLMLQQKEPGKVKPVFSVDWSLLKATQDSLREHMALAKAAQEREQQFREQVAAALAELRAEIVRLLCLADDTGNKEESGTLAHLRDRLDRFSKGAGAGNFH